MILDGPAPWLEALDRGSGQSGNSGSPSRGQRREPTAIHRRHQQVCERGQAYEGNARDRVKPQRGDWNLSSVRIYDSDYTIRMWHGGMEAYIQFCLDFYDHSRDVPVNLPPGSRASPVHMQGVFGMAGPLVSWERAMGFSPADILAGEEKWSVPEGTNLVVRRPDRPGHVHGAVRANSTG